MFTKYACKLLMMAVCTCIVGAIPCGVEGQLTELTSEAVECVTTTSELPLSCASGAVVLSRQCDWRTRSDATLPSLSLDAQSPKTSDQRKRNGFGGPLSR